MFRSLFPFKFSSSDDAVTRQKELEKRFGARSNTEKSDMLVDFPKLDSLSNGGEKSSGSPRMQHRVPIFSSDSSPLDQSVDSRSSPESERKPRVRQVPIQVQKPYLQKKTYSTPRDRSAFYDWLPEMPSESLVHNIPIKVQKTSELQKKPKRDATSSESAKSEAKSCSNNKKVKPEVKEKEPDTDALVKNALQNIETVKTKMVKYREEVESFFGTAKDKQYRYLDEMLTRCMLDLDAVETYGREDVRLNRKAMVKEVQACIDLLDSKIKTVHDSSELKDVPTNKTVDFETARNENVIESATVSAGKLETEAVDLETRDQEGLESSSANVDSKQMEDGVSSEIELPVLEERTATLNVEAANHCSEEKTLHVEPIVEEMGDSFIETKDPVGAIVNTSSSGVEFESESVMETDEVPEVCAETEVRPDPTCKDEPIIQEASENSPQAKQHSSHQKLCVVDVTDNPDLSCHSDVNDGTVLQVEPIIEEPNSSPVRAKNLDPVEEIDESGDLAMESTNLPVELEDESVMETEEVSMETMQEIPPVLECSKTV